MITILGATGSIGKSALNVIKRHPDLEIFALTAHQNWSALLHLIHEYYPAYVVLSDESAYQKLKNHIPVHCRTKCLLGNDGLRFVIEHEKVKTIISAMSGSAGLHPTYWAVSTGKKILLANKESLVIAGSLIKKKAQFSGARIIPIDSEHHAIWECAFGQLSTANCLYERSEIIQVVLTASGGALREYPLDQLSNVSVKQACDHPNWSMGKKITIDSATMMNKVLEVVEAFHLFDLSKEMIDVWLHPQSLIHALVGFKNGSFLAGISKPNMQVTLASALLWPMHLESGIELPNILDFKKLSFEKIDQKRYPAIKLLPDLLQKDSSEPIIANTANELAVHAFLNGKILFTDIVEIVEKALNALPAVQVESLDSIDQIQNGVINYVRPFLKT